MKKKVNNRLNLNVSFLKERSERQIYLRDKQKEKSSKETLDTSNKEERNWEVISIENILQSLYCLNLQGLAIKIEGKCSNVIVEKVTNCIIIFDSVVASIEFINCHHILAFLKGNAQSISFDTCQDISYKFGTGEMEVEGKEKGTEDEENERMKERQKSSLSRDIYTTKSNGIVIEEDAALGDFVHAYDNGDIFTEDEEIVNYIRCKVDRSGEGLQESGTNFSQVYLIPTDFVYKHGGGPRYLTKRVCTLSESLDNGGVFSHETYRVDIFGSKITTKEEEEEQEDEETQQMEGQKLTPQTQHP